MPTGNIVFLSHIEDYSNDLKEKCFEFFYWFSRFEFALKENGYVRKGFYDAAMPLWDKFRDEFAKEFNPTKEGLLLLNAPPQRQVYRNGSASGRK